MKDSIEVKMVDINLDNWPHWPPENYLTFNNRPTQKDINIINQENKLLIIELINQDDIDYLLTINNLKEQHRIIVCVEVNNIKNLELELIPCKYNIFDGDIKEWMLLQLNEAKERIYKDFQTIKLKEMI